MTHNFKLDCHVYNIEIDSDGQGTRLIHLRFGINGNLMSRSVAWPENVTIEIALAGLLNQVREDVERANAAQPSDSDLQYAFSIRLTHTVTLDTVRAWLREQRIMGAPGNDPSEYPERVRFDVHRDEAAGNGIGMDVLQVRFKYMTDASMFKRAFGGAA